MDPEALRMLADSLRTTMTAACGAKLDTALSDLGWLDMLAEIPDVATSLVFRLLGETGAHAPVLNDVVLSAAGQAALTAARHCQQVLAGIGFTAEHQLHLHVKRALVLDGLLGSTRDLTREAGAALRAKGFAPRLAQL